MKDQHFLFAIGFTDCLKMTASLQWVSQKWPHFENPTVNTTTNRKCHSSFVTFDLWLRCMNLANEIPFFWHVMHLQQVFSRFQMRSWLWIFLPGFKLFVFHLSYSLLSILKSMKHRAVCTKICQSWKISIFCLQ